jgi:hypothetical protein
MGMDLELIETELTLASINPAMADLQDAAEANLRAAHESARQAAFA